MVSRRNMDLPESPPRPPPTTPKGRENRLVSLAMDVAEKQMIAGTASSQVITHYLKLGSSREILEQEKIALENQLNETKRELMEMAAKNDVIYAEALRAMRSYSGKDEPEEVEPND